MTTQILRVSEPRDLLSVVPYQLGFTPVDSLVLISLRGPRRRIGVVMRVDLPPPGSGWPPGLVERLADHAVSDGATAALVALYSDVGEPDPGAGRPTDRPGAADPVEPAGAQAFDEVVHGLRAAGLDVADAWHVGPRRYRSLLCQQGCCPPGGWPVEELRSSRVGAEMVYRGLTVAGRREELVGDLTPVDAVLREAVEAVARAVSGRSTDGALPQADRVAALAAWRAAVAGGPAGAPGSGSPPEQPVAAGAAPEDGSARTTGTLLAGLTDVVVRDAVMLECVPGAAGAADELIASGVAGVRAVQALDGVFSAHRPVRPDPAGLEAASTVLRALVRAATGHRAAPPLALLAWASWWAGDGARAGDFAELALAADPGHSLALLLRDCAERGVAPGWAARDRVDDLDDRPRLPAGPGPGGGG